MPTGSPGFLNRRQFLGTSAGAALLAGLPRLSADAPR
ncbi:MAG: twin-arginine translocation signal domain-containing protein, partial [Planctomycetes bacterium]|nr:twin-arginine translocation signal domain-containing protein [Planctomycetota bacterium]